VRVGLKSPAGYRGTRAGRFQVLFVLNGLGMDGSSVFNVAAENELEKYGRDYDKMPKL
jgi:hypothetical protein